MCGFGGPDVGFIQVEWASIPHGSMSFLDFSRADLEAFLEVIKGFTWLGWEISAMSTLIHPP
jgi:hypothetical protein